MADIDPYDNAIRRLIVASKYRLGELRQQQLDATTLTMQDSYRLNADELQRAIKETIDRFPEETKGL